MESSKKIFASIVAAGILGTTAVAWAQPGMGGAGGCDMRSMGMSGMGGMGGRGMMKSGMKFDPAARAEQHLTWLKSELKPTAQQEPLWNAFAEKARSEAGKGLQAMRDKSQDNKNDALTAPERMAQMNAVMKERLAAHEAVTESFKRLYDSLTPEQKKAADLHMSRMGSMGPMGGPRGQRGGQPGPQGMGGEAEHRNG
jgi:hypothetical protein